MANQQYRTERDSLGEMKVPAEAYWGAQTQRAVENFPISGLRFPRGFIRALGMVKLAAAKANVSLGKLDERVGEAIIRAAEEVREGKLDAHFVVDIFQTGSGTSTNMNANEVIANRANELLGGANALLRGKIGDRKPAHPNDHVNMGQSSNDVIPTAMHVSAREALEKELLPALKGLQRALEKKAREFDKIVKIGRTHLQDATPLRLGQEFGGYASMVDHGIRRLRNARRHLEELAVGGTAVGTGINTHPKFARKVVKEISAMTRVRFREAENHFEAQGAKDAVVEASGALKTLAVSLMKIANDIRWLGSGPRCGLGELILPAVQPGSSIMPGKVNPVMAEALCMACAQVIGNDAAIAVGGLSGNLELNAMMPLMAYNLLQSISLLANAANGFTEKCLRGIKADRERIASLLEQSLALATALVPYIGYDAAAALAKEARRTGKTIREIAAEKKILPPNQLKKVLDPQVMTGPE
ncbi:MAG: class II fumarate hydratase [Calditrichaceae bacterium]|nr:class II fumarate hydratase [Calditrichia bacterium]NUQ41036.1 class II fumarate hydratase [Calditrichaceae bacterium]